MRKLIATTLLTLSLNAIAYDRDNDKGGNKYNPHSYGAPQLYYSPEARQEREEQELLRESNRIAEERLKIERERLQELRDNEK
ncbi:hypothetical protein B0F87_10566 [Methylobacter tundripaludum]|uniref:Uncharacterized protein n=1 Tax=Methylobacter tundripaludum TaxID=173365 RepID=A0A2S6HDT2_9GAMM|nr:hypothetical protein [Methylobacter tundripaludum]PPK75600.1 hypothetical protein B0F87_10566 [Methylobacter tundripaludum]